MMIALLGNAKNGADILSILDSFTAEDSSDEYCQVCLGQLASWPLFNHSPPLRGYT